MIAWRSAAVAFAAVLVPARAAAVEVNVTLNAPSPVGAAIEFSASARGSGPLTYTWDFGDGHKTEPSSSPTATHVYETPGHYPVIVVVKDAARARSASFLQTVHRQLPERRPASSSTIVYDRETSRVCNVNADNDTVSCVSTATLELLFEAPVGRHPRTLAVAPDGSLWVTNQDDATVSVLDRDDGTTLHTIELPRASKPFGIVIEPASSRAFVTLQATGELAEIDVSRRKLRGTSVVGEFPTGIAFDASATRLFVTRFISPVDQGEVVELDAKTLGVVRSVPLVVDQGPDTEATARGVPNYLRSVVPNPDGSLLWVPAKKDNTLRGEARDGLALTFESSVRSIVSLIDLGTSQELLDKRVDLNNRALGLSLTFSPLGDYAFVALLGNNGVEVLDAYDRRIVAGSFNLGRAPDGLVLDDAGRLYVNSFLSRSVVVLDAANVLASTAFSLEKIAEIQVSSAEKLAPGVLLGKQIFYDASDLRMAKDGYISCAACHLDGFEDGRVWDFTDRGEGLRNTTSLLGRRGVGQGRLHWSANFDEVQDFEHDIRGPFGGSGFLADASWSEGTRNTTLGDRKAGSSAELDALAEYVTSLDRVSPSPHRDPDGSLTEQGWRGLEVFQRAGCPTCHAGPDFTDSPSGVLHDVGTIQPSSGRRLAGVLEGIDTPTLRGVWETAPYLHDGSAGSLLDVIDAKNPDDRHGATRALSTSERDDLVSYLLQIDNVALEDETEPAPPKRTESDVGCSVSGGTSASSSSVAIWWALLALAVGRKLPFARRHRPSRTRAPACGARARCSRACAKNRDVSVWRERRL